MPKSNQSYLQPNLARLKVGQNGGQNGGQTEQTGPQVPIPGAMQAELSRIDAAELLQVPPSPPGLVRYLTVNVAATTTRVLQFEQDYDLLSLWMNVLPNLQIGFGSPDFPITLSRALFRFPWGGRQFFIRNNAATAIDCFIVLQKYNPPLIVPFEIISL